MSSAFEKKISELSTTTSVDEGVPAKRNRVKKTKTDFGYDEYMEEEQQSAENKRSKTTTTTTTTATMKDSKNGIDLTIQHSEALSTTEEKEGQACNENVSAWTTSTPFSRVKKMVRADADAVNKKIKIGSDVYFAITKAVDCFIQSVAVEGYKMSCDDGRRTLQINDLAKAVRANEPLEFLQDIIPFKQQYGKVRRMDCSDIPD